MNKTSDFSLFELYLLCLDILFKYRHTLYRRATLVLLKLYVKYYLWRKYKKLSLHKIMFELVNTYLTIKPVYISSTKPVSIHINSNSRIELMMSDNERLLISLQVKFNTGTMCCTVSNSDAEIEIKNKEAIVVFSLNADYVKIDNTAVRCIIDSNKNLLREFSAIFIIGELRRNIEHDFRRL